MGIVTRIVAGGPGRKTRFHTEVNDLISLREFRHFPRCLVDKVVSMSRQRRRDEPWWPMSVIPVIESSIHGATKVVEFGSGSSTVWLAKRAESVLSFEASKAWQDKVEARMARLGLDNSRIVYAEGESYYNHPTLDEFGEIDLAVVDGSYRWKCIESILPRMRKGGIVYLDNSDSDKDKRLYSSPESRRLAQKVMIDHAEGTRGASIERYSSLISGEIFAGEGMVLKVGS